MTRNYGLPYMGSKNSIARWIVEHLPRGGAFVDLFAGGCAVTHAAMEAGGWDKYIVNDIIPDVPRLFVDAVNGKYKNEARWISREQFRAEKDASAYIRLCWSFGNAQQNYLYSQEIEPYKKALHYALVLGDFNLYREFFPALPELKPEALRAYIRANSGAIMAGYIDWYKRTRFPPGQLPEIEALSKDINAEKERLRQYLIAERDRNGLKSVDVDRYLGTNGMAGHYYGRSQWAFPTYEAYTKLDEIMHWSRGYPITYKLAERLQSLENLQSLERLQSLESLQRLQRLQRLGGLERVQLFTRDYRTVSLPCGAVVYCDIPYRRAKGYLNDFDHDVFYRWAAECPELVIVSEYDMPPGFIKVAEKGKRSLLSGKGAGALMREGLYVHESKVSEYLRRMGRLNVMPCESTGRLFAAAL